MTIDAEARPGTSFFPRENWRIFSDIAPISILPVHRMLASPCLTMLRAQATINDSMPELEYSMRLVGPVTTLSYVVTYSTPALCSSNTFLPLLLTLSVPPYSVVSVSFPSFVRSRWHWTFAALLILKWQRAHFGHIILYDELAFKFQGRSRRRPSSRMTECLAIQLVTAFGYSIYGRCPFSALRFFHSSHWSWYPLRESEEVRPRGPCQ